MNNLKQLALNLCLKDAASFTNFFIGANKQLVDVLRNLYVNNESLFVYFWGKTGVGKSHLLSALCQLFSDHGFIAAYLPLEDAQQLDPQMLEDLEKMDVLCIDDLNLIAGNSVWEEAIFHCFNKVVVSRKQIVITANVVPQALQLIIPDLKSRMTGGLIFEVKELNDVEKIESLKLRAKLRGLELSDGAAQYLLNHYPRDPESLFKALDQLDKEALVSQRRLTVPFIKDVL